MERHRHFGQSGQRELGRSRTGALCRHDFRSAGYQNIASGIAGNQIVYNGNYLYYQVLGSPADGNGVSAVFGLVI